jgi:hypothetical protein
VASTPTPAAATPLLGHIFPVSSDPSSYSNTKGVEEQKPPGARARQPVGMATSPSIPAPSPSITATPGVPGFINSRTIINGRRYNHRQLQVTPPSRSPPLLSWKTASDWRAPRPGAFYNSPSARRRYNHRQHQVPPPPPPLARKVSTVSNYASTNQHP